MTIYDCVALHHWDYATCHAYITAQTQTQASPTPGTPDLTTAIDVASITQALATTAPLMGAAVGALLMARFIFRWWLLALMRDTDHNPSVLYYRKRQEGHNPEQANIYSRREWLPEFKATMTPEEYDRPWTYGQNDVDGGPA